MRPTPCPRGLAALLLLASACGGGGGTPAAERCGDGARQGTEQCDGADLGGASCVSLGFAGGALACGPSCALETGACLAPERCGDGVRQGTEQCDGGDLGGASCTSLGFAGGALSCDAACALVTTACQAEAEVCGDGVLQGEEDCDDGGTAGGDGCDATCRLEDPNSGWFAPGGGISSGHGS